MNWTPGPAWLFCPADRPERYPKALRHADVVILDLEDAVSVGNKEAARAAVRALVAAGVYDAGRTVLRLSSAASPDHAPDVGLVAELDLNLVMLAKAETPADLAALRGREVIALVETARGVESAGALAVADEVVGLMWGADDLIASLGGTSSRAVDGAYRDVARFARSRTLVAAKAAGRMALDAVFMDIRNLSGLLAECQDAVAIGFDATVAIHPSQIPVIREAYLPTAERVEWATRLLQAAGPDLGVTTFEGRMVDGPIFKQAERILRLAVARTGSE